MREWFHKFAERVSIWAGSYLTFVIALLVILIWITTGPIFHFSDTWQLVINTGTTIVTFLMVFLIQNTQNRAAKAVHLKLDEIIRAMGPARNSLIDLEELSDAELDRLEQEFRRLRNSDPEAEEEVEREIQKLEAAKDIKDQTGTD
jgi:low affinity Fe/Cu permease